MNVQYPLSINMHEYWQKRPTFLKSSSVSVSWMLVAVEDGSFDYEIEECKGTAQSGDVVFCPPSSEFHRNITAPLTYHYFTFRLNDPYIGAQNKTIELLKRAFQFKFRANELDRFFNNLRHLVESLHKPDEIALRHHFASDIWLMIQLQAEKMTQNEEEDRLIIEAKALIDRHAFREVRLQDIADRLHIHPVQFSRRFQRTFGLSPSHYLHSIRMERARNLLTSTEYTIDHISRLCGYENGFYFSRVFTRYCGLNPSRYRKLHSPNSL